MKAILAIDIGTSSTRARLYGAEDAAPIGAAAHIAHEPEVRAGGGSTLDPERLVDEVVACAAETAATAPAGVRILGVGVCSFWHSILGVDEDGAPTTPILLWSDRRSAPQVAALKAALPEAPARTGCPWHTSYCPGRLRWLAETDPEAFAASARFLSPTAYLFGKLFGLERAAESVSMASASGLFDQTRQAWDETLLAALGLTPARFVTPDDAPRRGLLPALAACLPWLAEVPWFPAIGDGAASNVGCGATSPERIALMIGTSGAMRVAAPEGTRPALPEGLWRYQVDPRRFFLGGALSNGGAVWAWLRQTLRLSDAAEAEMAALPPDGHGLTVLPFLAGERAPLWRDDLTAAVIGLTDATTPAAIARAHLEAVAFRFAALRDRLRTVAPQAELIGTGAGLKASPLWAQILADVLGEPLAVSAEEEASSRGAALWAREGLGQGRIGDAPRPQTVARFDPDPDRVGVYAAARARHEELLTLLRER